MRGRFEMSGQAYFGAAGAAVVGMNPSNQEKSCEIRLRGWGVGPPTWTAARASGE